MVRLKATVESPCQEVSRAAVQVASAAAKIDVVVVNH
jgi:hypothetical protein